MVTEKCEKTLAPGPLEVRGLPEGVGDWQPFRPDPLLLAIYESWKRDGANVTLEQREDGSHYIQIHPPSPLIREQEGQ